MQLYNSEYLDKSVDPTSPAKLESYEFLDLGENEKILDLGCGTGFDVIQMAKTKRGKGMVYGLDVSDEFIEIANKSKQQEEVENATFLVGTAEKLPFEDNFLDAVRVERVFQHLNNPSVVWSEIRRVLKPEGTVVIVETDWKGLSFYNPEFEVEKKLNDFLVHQRLNNGMASRNLVTELSENGFKNVLFDITSIRIPNYALANMFIKIEDLAKLAIHSGVVTEEEFGRWKSAITVVEKSTPVIGLLNMFVIKAEM